MRGVKNRVAIFFRTKQVVKMGGTLIVIAPEGFKFQTACAVEELEASYYAIQEPEQTVPVLSECCQTYVDIHSVLKFGICAVLRFAQLMTIWIQF